MRIGKFWKNTTGKMSALKAICVSVLGFLAVTALVLSGALAEIDRAGLAALRAPGDLTDPLGSDWFESLVRDVTAFGSFIVLTFLVVTAALLFLAKGKPRAATCIVAVPLSGWLLSHGLKIAFARPRPDIVPHEMAVHVASFPSGHTMNSAIVLLTLASFFSLFAVQASVRNVAFGAACVASLAIGLSRVYLGVHWPSDVLAGWLLGVAWAATGVFMYTRYWADARENEMPSD